MEVKIDRVSDTVSPSIDMLKLQVFEDVIGDRILGIQLVEPPTNLTARAKINYKTLLTWDAPSNAEGITYNVYKKLESPYFEPGDAGVTKVAEGITDTFYSDYNIDYGKTYYYIVTAVKEFNVDGTIIKRESTPTNNAYATVVAQNELDKQLGLEDYWGYTAFRTGGGDGYININTGNMVYSATDLVVSGPRLALVMRRTYNSQSTSRTALGDGWDFSFNTCLLKESDNSQSLLLKDGDGSIHRFTWNVSLSKYISNENIYMEITMTAKTDENGVYYEYKLHRNDDIEYDFDRNLLLTSFTEPNGNKIMLEYDHRGNVVRAYNNVNDAVSLIYDRGDRLIAVTDGKPVNASNEVTYLYEDITNINGGRTILYEQVDPEDLRDVQLKSASLWDRTGGNSTWTMPVKIHKEDYVYYPNVMPRGALLANIYDPKSTATSSGKYTNISYNTFIGSDGNVYKLVNKVIEPNDDFFTLVLTGDDTTTAKYDPSTATITDNYNRAITYVHNASGQVTQYTDQLGNNTYYEYDTASAHPYLPTKVTVRNKVSSIDAQRNAVTQDVDLISTYDYDDDTGFITSQKAESQVVGSQIKELLSYTSYAYYKNDPVPLKNNKLKWVKVQKNKDNANDVLTTTCDYDSYGNLTEVIAPPSSATDTRNRISHYSYYHSNVLDGSGNVSQYRIGLQESSTDEFYGKRTAYTYDMKGRLYQTEVKVKDGSGNYNTSLSTSGNITYDSYNQPQVVTDELGNQTVFDYDAFGLPKSVTQKDAAGTVLQYSESRYDANLNLIFQKGGKNSTNIISKTYFDYDILDRPIAAWQWAQTDQVGQTSTEKYIVSLTTYATSTTEDVVKSIAVKDYQEYQPDDTLRQTQINNLLARTDSQVSENHYDKGGRLYKVIVNGVTMAENTSFDNLGNVLEQKITIDVPANRYRYNKAYYDALGRPIMTEIDTNGEDIKNSVHYDFFGLEKITTDPLGKQTTYNYDYLSRLVKVTLPTVTNGVHDTTSYEYDCMGTIDGQGVFGNKTTNANGYDSITWMDRAGRKVREDVLGSASDPDVYTVYTYGLPNGSSEDTKGYTSQIKKVQRNDSVTKDTSGNIISRDMGSYEIYVYDDLGRTKKIKYYAIGSNTCNDFKQYDYNDIDNQFTNTLHKVINGQTIEEITEINTDKAGRTIRGTERKTVGGIVTDGTLGVSFTYDALGNIRETRHNVDTDTQYRTTKYEYDNNNRLSEVYYGENGTSTDNGLMKLIRSYQLYLSDGSVDTLVDHRDFKNNGTGYITRKFEYDSLGRIKIMTYADSTSTNSAKKMETHNITYYKSGMIDTETINNEYTGKNEKNITKHYTYDDIGRLLTSDITEQDGGDTNTLNDVYTYDAVGNRLTMSYNRTGEDADSYTLSYGYNAFNQLRTVVKGSVLSSSYEYDGRGNQWRENKPEKDNQGNYHDVITEYDYDLMNNMVKLTVTPSYEWNLMRSMTQTNEYNAAGQRVTKTESTVSKDPDHHNDTSNDTTVVESAWYYYSGSVLLFSTHNDASENIITPGGTLIASERFEYPYNGKFLFYNTDMRGSTTNLIDPEDGQSVQNYVYDEFGNVTESQNTVSNELQYTGSIKDSKSGLNYMNSRFYEPATGRFLSQDTYSGNAYEPWTQHLYSYCGNNPVNMIDPTGHRWEYINIYGAKKWVDDDGPNPGNGDSDGDYSGFYWMDPEELEGMANRVVDEAESKGFIDPFVIPEDDPEYMFFKLLSGSYVDQSNTNQELGYRTSALTLGITIDPMRLKASDIKALYERNKENMLMYNPGLISMMEGGVVLAGATISSVVEGGSLGGSKCFVAGTLVFVKGGLKPIEDIEIGDYIWSEDPETGEVGLKQVIQTFVSEKEVLIRVTVNGNIIETTEGHRFWVKEKGWIDSEDLKMGDVLCLHSGETAEVEGVDRVELDIPVRVYNFEVQDWHTYFVSEDGVLVHNEGCGSYGKGYSTPKEMNKAYNDVLASKDVTFTSKNAALDFINSKFGNFAEEVAGSRSSEGWHFDFHDGFSHINIYSKGMGFRSHITWGE